LVWLPVCTYMSCRRDGGIENIPKSQSYVPFPASITSSAFDQLVVSGLGSSRVLPFGQFFRSTCHVVSKGSTGGQVLVSARGEMI
jgi:hypothetical protein